jgi:hypothetical protein
LVAALPLSSIPRLAYVPVFVFVVGCLLHSYKSFIFGWLLAGALAQIGSDFELQTAAGGVVTRDMVKSFGSFYLGFVNLGLGNSALVLAGLFVVRYYTGNLDRALRIFAIPIILSVFSLVQYSLYAGDYGVSISNRIVVVGLFVVLGIANLPWRRFELLKVISWLLGMLGALGLLYTLNILGSYGGRAMWVFAVTAIPLAVYVHKTRKRWAYLVTIPLLLLAGYIFIFGTFWYKLLIISSFLSVILLPFIQRNRFLLLLFPLFAIALPLSSIFLERADDLSAIAGQVTTGRDEARSIGDLSQFSPGEVWDLVMYKYKSERTELWRSALLHTFSTAGINTIFPDPSGHFISYSGTRPAKLWVNGPHHGFLYLLRVYGLFAGFLIFGALNYWTYKAITKPYSTGPMRWVLQPFLFSFLVLGFHIGDYPLHSGSYFLYAILGLALAYCRMFPADRRLAVNRCETRVLKT